MKVRAVLRAPDESPPGAERAARAFASQSLLRADWRRAPPRPAAASSAISRATDQVAQPGLFDAVKGVGARRCNGSKPTRASHPRS